MQDAKLARAKRLRFYGFRNAYAKHDPNSPIVASLLETTVTISHDGNLKFTRAFDSNVMAELLANAFGVVQAPTSIAVDSTPQPNALESELESRYGTKKNNDSPAE